MGFSVNTNITAMRAMSSLSSTNRNLEATFERVSTGRRINSAKDDAAGLAVSEKLDAEVRSAGAALRNINDGQGVISIADGAAGEVGNILKRLRELAVQSSTGTLSNTERAYIDSEADALVSEIDRLASSVKFNGITLGDGSTSALTLFIGTSSGSLATLAVSLGDLTSGTLGVGGINLATAGGASGALATIDTALDTLAGVRADYGASSNRLDSARRSLETYQINADASRSQIVDADFAKESAKLSKYQVLQQAGISVLAQSKSLTQSALSLL